MLRAIFLLINLKFNSIITVEQKMDALKHCQISKTSEPDETMKRNHNLSKKFKVSQMQVERKSNQISEMKKRQRRTKIKKGIVAALICIAPLVIIPALFVS